MKEINQLIEDAVKAYGEAAANKTAEINRFCFPLESGKAAELLLCEYKNEVEARGSYFRADSETKERVKSVANWLTTRTCKPSLLLSGALPGTGKTTMARAIERMAKSLKSALDPQSVQGKRCREAGKYIPLDESERKWLTMCEAAVIVPRFCRAVDLAAMTESDRTAFDSMKRCGFLIIDDIGEEPVSVKLFGNEFFPVISVLEYRYDNMLPTIITSNLGLNALGRPEMYGERISSRLQEMCEKLYYTQSESYRR